MARNTALVEATRTALMIGYRRNEDKGRRTTEQRRSERRGRLFFETNLAQSWPRILRGVPQSGEVVAGTRTIQAFGS